MFEMDGDGGDEAFRILDASFRRQLFDRQRLVSVDLIGVEETVGTGAAAGGLFT